MENAITFHITESSDRGQVIYEVWQRNHVHGGTTLLAEANTRTEAREIMRHYASQAPAIPRRTEDE